MIKIIPVALFFLSFFASLVSNAILRRISQKNKILIDSPDNERKFHKNPTPLTGGIGISIGIIFSGIFLFFLTQNDLDINYTSQELLTSIQEASNDKKTKIHEINLPDGQTIKVSIIDNDSFLIALPDGKKQIYEISNGENSESTLKQEIKTNSISVTNFSVGLIVFTILIQLVMIIDDIWSIKEKNKLIIQAIFVLGLILFSDVYITNLGNLLGFGEIHLGIFGIPFTIFCIVGMMNAFNYIDGLNGLCASFSLVCLTSIIAIVNAFNSPNLLPLILPAGAIVGFLLYNLGIFGDKRNVFLGDNGSQALGFLCLWILVYFSQFDSYGFSPVTALWLVAIMFMDAVRVLSTRIISGLRGANIFKAKRDHIHHKLQDYGFSNELVYSILILLAGSLSALGIFLNRIFLESHYYSFYIFLVFWICFHLIVNKIPKNV